MFYWHVHLHVNRCENRCGLVSLLRERRKGVQYRWCDVLYARFIAMDSRVMVCVREEEFTAVIDSSPHF